MGILIVRYSFCPNTIVKKSIVGAVKLAPPATCPGVVKVDAVFRTLYGKLA